MVQQDELLKQKNELSNLVNNSNFLSRFQHKNYEMLINNYYDSAESIAQDWETWKKKYDKLKDEEPEKAKYKVKLDQAENDFKPYQQALTELKNELIDMEKLITKIDIINTKLDNLKPAGGTQESNLVKVCSCDITELSKDIKDVNYKLDRAKKILGIEETEVITPETQKNWAEKILKNNDKIKAWSEWAEQNKNQQPLFTTDKAIFIKALQELDIQGERQRKDRYLIWQDEPTQFWGVIHGSVNNRDRLYFYTCFDQNTHKVMVDRAETWWIKQELPLNPNRNFDKGWRWWDMNRSNNVEYSLKWSLGLIYIITNAWNRNNNSPNWDDMKDERNWKSQIEKI